MSGSGSIVKPESPSPAIGGSSLVCSIVTDLRERPPRSITLPGAPRYDSDLDTAERTVELNNGALSVLRYGDDRRNLILAVPHIPDYVGEMLREMRRTNRAVKVYTVESGRVILAAPLAWKVGGEPSEGVYSGSLTGGAPRLFVIQFDEARGYCLEEISADSLAFLGYIPGCRAYETFPTGRGGFFYRGNKNAVQNSLLEEGAPPSPPAVPDQWTYSDGSDVGVAGTNYGIVEDSSFLNPTLSTFFIRKTSASSEVWKLTSSSFAVTAGETICFSVGVTSYTKEQASVFLTFNDGGATVVSEAVYGPISTLARKSTTVPAGATAATLSLSLPGTLGEVRFSAPQVLRGVQHTVLMGLSSAYASWEPTRVYYDLPDGFVPHHGGELVVLWIQSPGWYSGMTAGDKISKTGVHLCDPSRPHSLTAQFYGGLGGANLRLLLDGTSVDTAPIDYEVGDSFACALYFNSTGIGFMARNMRNGDTATAVHVAAIPVEIMSRLYVGIDGPSGVSAADGLIGNVLALTRGDSEGDATISDMLAYLSLDSVRTVLQDTIGRRFRILPRLHPLPMPNMLGGTILFTEIEKY